MKYQKGFTIIEVLVVIIVITILVSIGTAQLLRTQPVTHDRDRANDVKTIKLHLEDIYKNGQVDNTVIPSGDASVTSAVSMGYPSTKLITTPSNVQSASIINSLDARALKSPLMSSSAVSPTFALVAATTNSPTVTPTPSKTNDVYVYQPLDQNGVLCQFATGNVTTGPSSSQNVIAPRLIDKCVKFNLYYYSEIKNTVEVVSSLQKMNNGL